MSKLKAIDLFAGAGGFSTGARMAGMNVVWAANHWELAVRYHAANHPRTAHVCQDLHQANWLEVPGHDIVLASPSCQGHSRARGKDKAHHDATRSTAWAVVSCLEAHRTPLALVENVVEFLEWELYPAWHHAMRKLGYRVAAHVLDAADFGVPQHRKRLFLVCSRSRAALNLRLRHRQHRPVNDILDWEAEKWSPVNKPGRSLATLARIDSGRARFGRRFVAPFYGSGSGTTGRSVMRPVGTMTTRDRWAVVDGSRMRMMNKQEVRAAMGFPVDYQLPPTHKASVHLLGNAVCPPVAAALLRALQRQA